MTGRSRAREVALQLLYQRDLNPRVGRPAVEAFVRDRLREDSLREFALRLFDGVVAHQRDLDLHLIRAASNWRLARMAAVDRNAMRIATFELLHAPETPPGVVLDEAIELTRRFGGADSPAFVNGVLDQVRKSVAPAAEA